MRTDTVFRFFISTLSVAVVACASGPRVDKYPAGSNAQDITSQLGNELASVQNQQLDVIAPKNFAEAQAHLQKSKDIQSRKNFTNESALEELSLTKAYLAQARETYKTAAPLLVEVTEARHAALQAGAAKNHKKELKNIDEDFVDMSKKIEKGQAEVDLKDKARLQKQYLDLELKVIKSEKLADTRMLLKKAKEINANQIAPKTWASAESKLSNAEAIITADRHDNAAINGAVILAKSEAQKVYDVTNTARNAKSHNSEDVALDIYNKKGEISELGKEISEAKSDEQATQSALTAKERELAFSEHSAAGALSNKNRELAQAEQKQRSLEAEKRFNESLQNAQKQFEPSDAVVYQQGNNLVIRLKSVNFTSGKSDLPSHAMSILGKTKQVIKDLNPQKIIVEGHTDSIGSHEINLRVSQERADTVAKYLSADNSINRDNIETKGLADAQPLSSNKTKVGRAENRRVDIVITPNPIE